MFKSYANAIFVFLFVLLFAPLAFAQDASDLDFLAKVFQAVKDFGGLATIGKIASVIGLIIASIKSSFLNQLIWRKLGAAQVFVAPILALAYGVLTQGSEITFASAFAYLMSGAAAISLHELLDALKAAPWIGSKYVWIIDLISGALGYKPAPQVEQSKAA